MKEEIRRKIQEKSDIAYVMKAIEVAEHGYPEYIPGVVEKKQKGEKRIPYQMKLQQMREEAESGVVKGKRKLSPYNIFIGECMRDGQPMQVCAALYKEQKEQGITPSYSSPRSSETRNERDAINEHSSHPTQEDVIELITEEGCPICDDMKEILTPYILDGKVVEVDVSQFPDIGVDEVPKARVNGKIGEFEVLADGVHIKIPGESDVILDYDEIMGVING